MSHNKPRTPDETDRYLDFRRAIAGENESIERIFEGSLSDFTVIESLEDFPEPVGNVSTLTSGVYRVNGNVIMGSTREIVVLKGAILAGASGRDALIWTGGTGPHITFDGAGGAAVHDIRNLTLVGASGEDMFATTNTPATILLRAINVITAGVGLFNISNVWFATECQFIDGDKGIRFGTSVGASIVFRLSNMAPVSGATGACLDLESSVWNLVTLDDVQFSPDSGGSALGASASNANLTPVTGRGEVESCRFNGTGGNITGGVTVDDLQWLFSGNAGLSNSLSVGQWNLSGNSTTTTAEQVFVAVAGTFVAGFQHRYALNAAGVLTYIGLNPRPFETKVALLAQMASGGSKSVSFQMYHTPQLPPSTPVAVGDPFTIDVDNKPTLVELHAAIELLTGDSLQIRLQNNVDAVGVTVTDASGLNTGIPTGV